MQNGGSVLVEGDDQIPIINSLLDGTGIVEIDLPSYESGILTDILPHECTQGVDTIIANSYGSYCVVTTPAVTITLHKPGGRQRQRVPARRVA